MPSPFVTQEPLQPKAFEGLKEPGLLMAAFNRLQGEAGILNAGLTLANARRVVLADKELVTPASEWTTLSLLAAGGFDDTGVANGYAPLSVLKQADGVAFIQGRLQRAAGAPPALTAIAQLPPGYAPASAQRRVGDATGYTLGVWHVDAGGSLRYLAGDPTNDFSVSGSWVAADKSLPAWSTSFRCRLPVENANPNKLVVRSVLIAARSATTADAGLLAVTSVYAPAVERVDGERFPNLVLPRIDGLREGTRYRLTLWAFLE
jgi:hypothetical protein